VARRDEIVATARSLLEEEGPAALTMRRLADRLGIRAPSLYKHVSDKEELEAALAALALEEIAAALAPARGLGALARAYRRYALSHPHLYRLTTERPLPRGRLPEGLEARAAAPLLAVAGGIDRARAVWAFAHGMVQLELAGRFPPEADLEAAWREGVAAFARELPAPQSPRAVVRSWRGPD
jgi:AcrR family transcriptional regulator